MIGTVTGTLQAQVDIRVRELNGMYPVRYFAFAGDTKLEAVQHFATWLTIVSAENPALELISVSFEAFDEGPYELLVTVSFANEGVLE